MPAPSTLTEPRRHVCNLQRQPRGPWSPGPHSCLQTLRGVRRHGGICHLSSLSALAGCVGSPAGSTGVRQLIRMFLFLTKQTSSLSPSPGIGLPARHRGCPPQGSQIVPRFGELLTVANQCGPFHGTSQASCGAGRGYRPRRSQPQRMKLEREHGEKAARESLGLVLRQSPWPSPRPEKGAGSPPPRAAAGEGIPPEEE